MVSLVYYLFLSFHFRLFRIRKDHSFLPRSIRNPQYQPRFRNMNFEIFGSKKRAKAGDKDALNYRYQVRHEDTRSKEPNSYFYNLLSPWISKSISTRNRVKSQIDYITVAPKKCKDVNPTEARPSDAKTPNPEIHVIAPRSNVTSSRNRDEDTLHDYKGRSISLPLQQIENVEAEVRKSRHQRHSQSNEYDCQTIASMDRRKSSSHSRSSTRSRSHRSSSCRRSIGLVEPAGSLHGQNICKEQALQPVSERRTSRGRSTSYPTTYRIERRATRTPSPLPELECRSVDSPLSPGSHGPETPLVDREARPYSKSQKTGYSRIQDDDHFSPRENDCQREPVIYDEQQHSPEAFYNPLFSSQQCLWPNSSSDVGQSRKIGNPKYYSTSFLSTPSPNKTVLPKDVKITSAPPVFELPIASPSRRSQPADTLSSPRSTRSKPSQNNYSESTFNNAAENSDPSTNQPSRLHILQARIAQLQTTPSSSRNQSSLPLGLPASSPPSRYSLDMLNSSPSVTASISYERLRPIAPPSSVTSSPGLSLSSHRRIGSDIVMPTRKPSSSERDVTSPTRRSQVLAQAQAQAHRRTVSVPTSALTPDIDNNTRRSRY